MKLLSRLCLVTLGGAILLAPFVGWGASRTLRIAVDDATMWLPPDFPVRRHYDRFTRDFENGDVLIVSWPGCTIDDERLARFSEALRDASAFQDADGRPHFERVVTGPEILERLTGPPAGLTAREALNRLGGVMIGEDGTTCAIITFSKAGVTDRQRAVRLIRGLLDDTCHIPQEDQHLAGPIIDGHDVEIASTDSLHLFGPLSSVVILASCYWCLRSWRVALPVFLLALYCEALTLALVHYCGGQLTPLMIVMPSLVLVIGVSGGIHLVNYYHDALRVLSPREAPARALATGWLPCVLSAGTTAIGMGSLTISHIGPIREFGLFSAIGVTVTPVALFLLLPGAFELWPQPRKRSERSDSGGDETAALRALARWLARNHAPITVISIIVMLAAGWGVRYLHASVRIQTLFRPQARILRDYAWLEEHIGPLVSVEVLMTFHKDCPSRPYDRLRLVANVERELQELEYVRGTFSAATFFPDSAVGRRGAGLAIRTAINRRLERSRQQLTDARYLHDGETGDQTWRITVRVSALEAVDYGHVLHDVERHIRPALDDQDGQAIAGVSAAVTGAMPLVHQLQHDLFDALLSSFLSAFVVIAVVMMFNERGVLAGLVAMVPNLFPMILMFGILGWLDFPMDIGSVMTASVALGMAIDGTLHFLTFFRRGVDSGQTDIEAIEHAYEHCAPAMTESSVICGLGLATFAFSSFLPTNRFAWLMLALIAAALAGDLVVLPALLAGPCGRLYRSRKTLDSLATPASRLPTGT